MSNGVRVLGDSFFESVEVELIFDEVFVDFAEEAVVFQSAEPLDPAHVHLLAELRLLTHNYYL
jgi:hypothetical protein